MSNLQINRTMTPAYNPQSNLVERFHRVLGQMLRVLLERDDPSWVKLVGICVFAYNTKLHTSTGMTPYAALFGREARLPLDLILENPAEKYENTQEFVKDVLNRTREVYAYIRRNGEAVIRRNSNLYSGNQEEWEPGCLVWYCSPRPVPGKPDKLVNAWRGPFKVVRRIAEVLVDICPSGTEGKTLRVHVTRLKKYQASSRTVMKDTVDADMDDLEGEEIAGSSRQRPELAIPVFSGGTGIEIQNLPAARKDAVEETLRPMPGPAEVADQVAPTNEDEARPADEPMENSPPVVEAQAEGDVEMTGEARPAKRVREPSVPGQEADNERPVPQRRRLLDAARQLAESSDSSEDEMATLLTNSVLEVLIQRKSKQPVSQTAGAAGYDLRAAANVQLEPGRVTPVPLNLRMAIPAGYYMQLASRSGLASRGLMVVGGVIDSDFRGEVQALILNWAGTPFKVTKGQRICQGLFLPVLKAEFKQQDELPNSVRGVHGFGSTGS